MWRQIRGDRDIETNTQGPGREDKYVDWDVKTETSRQRCGDRDVKSYALRNLLLYLFIYLFIYLTPEIHSLTYKNTSLCTLGDYHMQ